MRRKLLVLLTMALMLVAMMAAAAPAGAQVIIACPAPGSGTPPCIPCPNEEAIAHSPAIESIPGTTERCRVTPPQRAHA